MASSYSPLEHINKEDVGQEQERTRTRRKRVLVEKKKRKSCVEGVKINGGGYQGEKVWLLL